MAVARDRRVHRRRLAYYYGAKFGGQTAQNLFFAALVLVAGTSSNAAIDLSSLFVAFLIPGIALGPLGGALVDRVGPARGYILGASLRLSVVMAGLFLLDSAQWAWAFAFAYSAVSQVFSPSEVALVKTLQGERSRIAHSWSAAIQYGGQGMGMLVIAPAAYLWGGDEALVASAALGFAATGLLAAVLGWDLSRSGADQRQRSTHAFRLAETCRFFLDEPRAAYAVVMLAMKTLVSRVVVIALPFYMQKDMGLGNEAMIYLLGPGILGIVVGLFWAGRRVTVERAHSVMRHSMAALVVAVLALAALDYGVTAVAHYSQVPPIVYLEASVNTTFAVALPVAFLVGLALTTSMIGARVALTETAPEGQQARVFAVSETLTEVLVVAPLLLAGVGTQVAGARSTLLAVGAIGLAAMLVLELRSSRRLRDERAATHSSA